ncbi:hypothetical protein NDU88_006206 [Pleurodeles waltl]|uniref:Uncharacterized protein n=1 Tax=Pleurodeles waltl TaxID=8319 RepID=A0AAV7PQ00_PLEWA|nr:hypothetical protein NDU88_006206 [Pleurodeles waltl]
MGSPRGPVGESKGRETRSKTSGGSLQAYTSPKGQRREAWSPGQAQSKLESAAQPPAAGLSALPFIHVLLGKGGGRCAAPVPSILVAPPAAGPLLVGVALGALPAPSPQGQLQLEAAAQLLAAGLKAIFSGRVLNGGERALPIGGAPLSRLRSSAPRLPLVCCWSGCPQRAPPGTADPGPRPAA